MKISSIISFSLVLILSMLAYGTKLRLRNGAEYEGEIVSENTNFFILKIGKTNVNILKTMVVEKEGVKYVSEKDEKRAPALLTDSGSGNETGTAEGLLKIRLKNGKTFQGNKISENDRMIVIESKGSRVNIFKSIVAEIDSSNVSSGVQEIKKPALQQLQSAESTKTPDQDINSDESVSVPVEASKKDDIQNSHSVSGAITPDTVPQLKADSRTLRISHPQSDTGNVDQHLETSQPDIRKPAANVKPSENGDNKKKAVKIAAPRKRADGKTEILLRNGTSFVGKISSENERFISFLCEGASINILKKLIKEIDGVPYVRDANLINTDSLLLANRIFTENKEIKEVVKLTEDISLKRAAPTVKVPENTSVSNLTNSLRSLEWQKRSMAARMLGGMGQWAISAIPDLAILLADTVEAGKAAPIWFDSAASEQLLAPGLEAGRALASMGASGFQKLSETFTESDPLIRKSTVFGLCEFSDDRAMDMIIAAMRDINAQVRLAALGGFHSVASIEHIISALKDENQDVRMNAAAMLGKLKDSRAINPLADLLKDKKSQVRVNAARAIGEIGGPEGTLPLIEALKDMNMFVRESAARALGEANDTAAVSPLILAMKDESVQVRIAAVKSLCSYRDPRAIPSLYALLTDENKVVKDAVEKALILHADIATLIKALDDHRPIVRGNAAYLLWVMTGKDYGLDKEKWLEWEKKNR